MCTGVCTLASTRAREETASGIGWNARMSAKGSLDYISDSYDGGVIGRNSPAALLDMLAEVASQTLHSEKKRFKSVLGSQCKAKGECTKRKCQESFFSVPQLLSMSASQLVKHFSVFAGDELKRQYSYTCALVADCGQKYTSFASEGRARMSIKAHLTEHLQYLKADKDAYNSFVAKAVSNKTPKPCVQNKRGRLQQLRKPQETLNKENKDISMEKSTHYLRNILLSDVKLKEFEKQKTSEKTECFKELSKSEAEDSYELNLKFLGDHSYSERVKDEMPNEKKTSSLNEVANNRKPEENVSTDILLMVVGAESVQTKEYSPYKREISEPPNHQQSGTFYVSKMPDVERACNKSTDIIMTKPKGKAKFIGTSKEEREMALAFMDRIKKKGNPTGSNLQCRICDPPRSFTAPTTLVSHYRSHAGIKPYECRICGAVFTRRHSLKYHMLIHQNQTRFTCADCGKKFRHPSHFREHRRRHTGEAPFGCDDCGQRFKTRNTYKRHLKTRHGKVLTTNGDFLYLSEEDFQKLRTNRKKKTDYNVIEHTVKKEYVPSETVMSYEGDDQRESIDIPREYVGNENLDEDRTWRVNECFKGYEVCAESHSYKTEDVETEVFVDNNDHVEVNASKGIVEKVQGRVSETVSYSDAEITENAKESILCEDTDRNESEVAYDNTNQEESYVHVQYQDDTEETGVVNYQKSIDFLPHSAVGRQVLQCSEESYCDDSRDESDEMQIEEDRHEQMESMDIACNNNNNNIDDNGKVKTCIQLVVSDDAEYEQARDYAVFEENAEECNAEIYAEVMEFTEDVADDAEETESILEAEENETLLSEDSAEQIYEIEQSRAKHRMYVYADSLKKVSLGGKYIKILPQRTHMYLEHRNQLECKRLLNRQAIALKQNGKQGTILLLANNALKNGILQINETSIVVDGTIEKSM